jgi:thiol-disulfide isomerase/thioredoxin
MKSVSSLLLVAIFLATDSPSDPPVPTVAEIRERNFTVTTLDGATLPLGDLLVDGQPLVIEFWATWCTPCRKTLPHLIALQQEHGQRLRVLGLTVEDPGRDRAKVHDYVNREGVNFVVAFAMRELFQFMNNRPDIAVPKLFVYDDGGNSVTYIPRYSPLTARKLESAVRRALSKRVRPAA